ncbi:hypothetical protein [Mesoplasma corruscae]|uniref:Uncharacterized protein n=1 Tax=Mesoplasma corruscae TaxID=216874 RepID=A0A2S5RH94_9MOLU|nr:hypothetical protein [Mesoplasma corruscae]PPE06709.1 hypothetical protein MCORR_v1c03400 [Mesoplasma corruscae]
MQKQKIVLKSKMLNFRIKDTNEDFQKFNVYLYKVSFFNIIIFCLTIIPIIVFSITFFVDVNLKFYFDHYKELSKIVDLPSKQTILTPLAISWVFITFCLMLILFLKPVITSKTISNGYKNLYWVILLLFEITVFLLAAISQYSHNQYQNFFDFQSLLNPNELVDGIFKEATTFFAKNKQNSYKWVTTDLLWWFLFLQFAVVFMMSLSIQNSIVLDVDQLNIDNYITYINKKQKKITSSRIKEIFSKVFNNSDRTLAAWTIITAFCILIPSLTYIFLTSFNSTNIAKLSSFIDSFPNFARQFDTSPQLVNGYENLIIFSNKYFAYSSLPVIIIGIALSILVYFVSVLTRGNSNSQQIFILQYGLTGVMLLLVLGVIFYSEIEISSLLNTWNENKDNSTIGSNYLKEVEVVTGYNWEQISNHFNIDKFRNRVIFKIVSPINIFSQFIVLTSTLITSFAIVGKNIYDKSNFKNNLKSKLTQARIK